MESDAMNQIFGPHIQSVDYLNQDATDKQYDITVYNIVSELYC